MSGHSKWSKVKRQKEVTDKQKAAIFAKLSKLITLSVIEGGGIADPEHNIRLRLSIEQARQSNMPKENIQRAIEKASGPDKNYLKEYRYEAFGPHGVGLIIIATTDNPNRTISEVKNVLDRHGGKIGSQGAVSYLFQHCALITFLRSNNREDTVFAFAESLNAYDIDEDDEYMHVYVPFQNIGKIKDASSGLIIHSQIVEYRPISTIDLQESQIDSIKNIIEALEDLDDVQQVYTNAL